MSRELFRKIPEKFAQSAKKAALATFPLAAGISACGEGEKLEDPFDPILNEYVQTYGGVVALEVNGLPEGKQLSILFQNESVKPASVTDYDFKIYTITGIKDGIDLIQIMPTTSCDGVFSISTIDGNSTLHKYPVQDTLGKYNPTFTLGTDCIKRIPLQTR